MFNHSETASRLPAVAVKPQPIPPQAANIRDCSITTDSVVATAIVKTDTTMRRVVVQWGDGTINTLRSRPGIEVAIGQPPQLPAGTYKLTHAYAGPENRLPFEHIVLIRVEDQSGGVDFCLRRITLTPRYRVTNYRTSLILGSKCDSWFEHTSEFDITLHVDGAVTNTWHWEPWEPGLNHVGWDETPFVLEGSVVSRELTVADGSVPVHLDIIERDPSTDEHLQYITVPLSALAGPGTFEGTVGEPASGCKVRYRLDREVTLIVPLPSYGQAVVAAQA
jgi:hypothetical protein